MRAHRGAVAPQGDHGPDRLDHPERPRAAEEPVRARERAAQRERGDEPWISSLERVHHHHERDNGHAVHGQHLTEPTGHARSRWPPPKPAATLRGVEVTRLDVGHVGLRRVPYADVLVGASGASLTPDQVASIEWAEPVWAEAHRVRVAAAVWIIEANGRRIVVDPAQAADDIL